VGSKPDQGDEPGRAWEGGRVEEKVFFLLDIGGAATKVANPCDGPAVEKRRRKKCKGSFVGL
jgi:hypothetical protein